MIPLRISAVVCILSVIPSLLAQSPSEPLPRTVSSSRQFTVYHPDRLVRSAVARRLEEIKSEFLRLVELRDNWQTPIIVAFPTEPIRRKATLPILTSVLEGDGGAMRIQIDVFDPAALKDRAFELEVARSLCWELAIRDRRIRAGQAINSPPPWLIEGLIDELRLRQDTSTGRVFAAILQQSEMLKLDAFLKQKPELLDATSRLLYRARAYALLQAMLELPGGRKSFERFLRSLGERPYHLDEMLSFFPALEGRVESLSRYWVLSIAKAAAGTKGESLGAEETARRLAAMLEIETPRDTEKPEEPPLVGIEAIQQVARERGGAMRLSKFEEDFLRFETQAHPLYRPLVSDYRQIFAELKRRPKRRMEKRYQELEEIRLALDARTTEISDYLNWYEASKVQTRSGKFDDIITFQPDRVQRTDPVSRTLDTMVAHGW